MTANYRSCFSIPVGSILELVGSSSKCTVVHHPAAQLHYSSAPVLHHSSAVLHHSSAQFCTIRLFSSAQFVSSCSAPFVSSVLHHSLATILSHLLMPFYNFASSNNLATDANTPSRLFNCIVEILVLATASCRTFRPTCRLFIILSRFSFTILASSRYSSALQLNY